MNTHIATKFVPYEVPPLEALSNSPEYRLREKINSGARLTREEKDWIACNIHHCSYFKTSIALRGYRFDFSDVLHCYIIKQYGSWSEHDAPDRTSLRRAICGRSDHIIENI